MSRVSVGDVHASVCMPNLVICFKRLASEDSRDDWLLDRITISTPNLLQDTKIDDKKPASEHFADDVWTFLANYLPTNPDELVLSGQGLV